MFSVSKMRKLTVLPAVAILSLALVSGCGAKEASGDQGAVKTQEAGTEEKDIAKDAEKQQAPEDKPEDKAAAGSEASGEEDPINEIFTLGDDDAILKTGMVSDVAGINDQSFNQSAWEGMKFLNLNVGARVSYIEAGSEAEFERDLDMLTAAGNEICWGVGYKFADAVLAAAKSHPDTHYGIVDYAYDDIPENVTCALFRAQEPSFLAGYIAARVSKTGKVGFVGGMDVDTLRAFQYGYMGGVALADRECGTKTEVVTDYIGSFEDSYKGMTTADSMYAGGCDVIFHAAGGAGEGVIDSAKNNNKFVIGVDCDQSYLAPDNVLTSVVKRVDVILANISVQYGMRDNIGGKELEYGLAEHALEIPPEHPNYSDEIYDDAMEVRGRIVSNEIIVPHDETSYNEFMAEE